MMKTKFLLTALAGLVVMSGCSTDEPAGRNVANIEMVVTPAAATSVTGAVLFYTVAKSLAVDWGDGNSDNYTNATEIAHFYANKDSSYTIKIVAEGLEEFGNRIRSYNINYFMGKVQSFSVVNCPYLKIVSLSSLNRNVLNSITLNNCPALALLDCSYNKLTTLDVSKNTALIDLYCAYNQLTELDISKNTALETLSCCNNQLTALNVSKSMVLLRELICYDNQLTAPAIDAIFTALPDYNGLPDHNWDYIDIRNNPGSADCTSSIAENKGWRVNR
jgi:hypothetical protein